MSSSSQNAETARRLANLKALVLLPRNEDVHTRIWKDKLSAYDLQYTLQFASDGFLEAVESQLVILEEMVTKLKRIKTTAENVLHEMQTASRDSMKGDICAMVRNRWLMEELTAMILREQYGDRRQPLR